MKRATILFLILAGSLILSCQLTDLVSVFGPPAEFVIRMLAAVDIPIELFNSKIFQLE